MTIKTLKNDYRKKANTLLFKNKSKFMFRHQWSIEDRVRLKVYQEIYKELQSVEV